jgi:hypothetical protein
MMDDVENYNNFMGEALMRHEEILTAVLDEDVWSVSR